ncbi:MAG: DUF4870 domain-containing protein [Bacteroidales bacterium]|nr:DUF4870 domain-containing protein [Bacteroidales bacterium]MBN2820119.1 DUF4870 domain-containing protein [Bacteroidales bacterium]
MYIEGEDRTIAWLSYLTPIGWLVAIFMFLSNNRYNSLAQFHLKQSLGIFISAIIAGILNKFLIFIPVIGVLSIMIINLLFLVLWILGLVAAVQGEKKEVPFIGRLSQELLNFIK